MAQPKPPAPDPNLPPKLPCNIEAERAILGAVLLDGQVPNKALAAAREKLTSGDFFQSSHAILFRHCCELEDAGLPVDSVVLVEKLGSQVETAGGAAYIAQLMDGTQRVSNVGHYAEIVKEKSLRRGTAHMAEWLRQRALEPSEESASLLADAEKMVANVRLNSNGHAKIKSVEGLEFMCMQIPVREMMLSPIIPTQGLCMLFSKRGVGKTYIGLGISCAVAKGEKFLRWTAEKPRGVVYADGEMPAIVMQERMKKMDARGIRLVTPDLQAGAMPNLSMREGQDAIESLLEPGWLLVLDNLSTLCRGGKENEGESWEPVQGWMLHLRQRGISVLLVHHAGKDGEQRGASRREDVLDTVIELRNPGDYSPDQGLRCEVHYRKCRGLYGEEARPFEVGLTTGVDDQLVWITRTLEDSLMSKVGEFIKNGSSLNDMVEELNANCPAGRRGYSRSSIHRAVQKFKAMNSGLNLDQE